MWFICGRGNVTYLRHNIHKLLDRKAPRSFREFSSDFGPPAERWWTRQKILLFHYRSIIGRNQFARPCGGTTSTNWPIFLLSTREWWWWKCTKRVEQDYWISDGIMERKDVIQYWIISLTSTFASFFFFVQCSSFRGNSFAIKHLFSHWPLPVILRRWWCISEKQFNRPRKLNYDILSRFLQEKVKDAFDTAIWDALLSQQQSIKKPLWRRLFCLAWTHHITCRHPVVAGGKS